MSGKVEIVYFLGCPNASVVIEILRSNRIPFEMVIQNRLLDNNPKKNLSSPSILVNGVQAVGSVVSQGSSACSFGDFSPQKIMEAVRSALVRE